ncbi:MAG: hypothetical protein KDA24_13180 [Deltaproteobacteria bacterium]|nr:hypothetical protein [Deltaproteobacteria bacterium]
MLRLRLAVPLVAALFMSACTPCKDACRVEARQFEDCLGAWGMEWADVAAIDRVDYRITCVGDVDVWMDSLSAEARADERQTCQAFVDDLRGETDCDAAWEALVGYGAL